MVEITQPLLLSPQSSDSSSNHLEQQMEDMEQIDLTAAGIPQMVELQRFHHSNHPSDSPSNHMEQQMEDEAIIDIKAMIENCEDGLLSTTSCIYRVPPTIRHLKEEAYIPKAVSIGPFHHGDLRLQDMERHKQIMFKRFKQRTATSLEDLYSLVRHLEAKVRASYSEDIKIPEKEFVKLILVDGGFIIELFMESKKHDENIIDAKLSQRWLVDTMTMDLILLENQLPFFVLQELFDIAFPPNLNGDLPSFHNLTYSFFSYFNIQNLEPNSNVRVEHFTDLVRLFYLPRTSSSMRVPLIEGNCDLLLYSANELKEAGIKFKASRNKCLLDLKFSGCVLEIPQILVEDDTEILFRNMMALEQCRYPYGSCIVDYVFILDCLVKTDKDVDILTHKKIICNWLGDSYDVAELFKGLDKNILAENFSTEYLEICKRLNRFYQNPFRKMKATLTRDYCKTPWQTVASIAGIALLIFTLIQTQFSILQILLK